MATDLSKGTTFAPGTWAASDLNNLVDQGTILSTFITNKTTQVPAAADSWVFYSSGAAALSKCSFQDIINNFPNDPVPATKGLRSLGTGAQQACAGNDTRLSASVKGIRKSAGGGSTDTAAGPNDIRFASVNMNAATNFDASVSDFFYDTALASNKTYTVTNFSDGRSFVFQVNQNGHTVTWPGGYIQLGSSNTAGWNVYCVTHTTGATLVTVAN